MDNKQIKFDRRVYKHKNPSMNFYCPLCSTPRSLDYSPRLKRHHYIQIFMVTGALTALFYPLMGMKGICVFFLVWMGFEASVRMLFKKEIPCPHCGFDATWYKRDVKVARDLVGEFWKDKAIFDEAKINDSAQADNVAEQV